MKIQSILRVGLKLLVVIIICLGLVIILSNQNNGVHPVDQLFNQNQSLFNSTPQNNEINYNKLTPNLEIVGGKYLELKQHSKHYHHGDGNITFSSKLGDTNTWNGTHWNYFIWNNNDLSVQFANTTINFYPWYSVIQHNNNIICDDSRWDVEYWRTQGGGSWRSLDLYNHIFYNPTIQDNNINITQGYNDGFNFMNVTYIISNQASCKLEISFLSGSSYTLRFGWHFTGLDGDPNYNNISRTFDFADIFLSLNDTDISKRITQSWSIPSKKLDVYIENYTVIQNDRVLIDPTFSEKQTSDEQDFYWAYNGAPDPVVTDQLTFRAGNADQYYGYCTFDTDITDSISSISDVSGSLYCTYENIESGETIVFGVYYNTTLSGGFWNETYALSCSSWFPQDESFLNGVYHEEDFSGGTGNYTFDDSDLGSMLDEWQTIHNTDPSNRPFIPLYYKEGTGIDSGEMVLWGESSTTEPTYRSTLTFIYVLGGGGNNAPNAPTLNQDSGNTYGGKSFTVITDHTDDDGGADIETMYLEHSDPGYNVTLSCPQATSSGSVTVITGSGYLEGTPTYSHTGITNGYRVTWTITFDWDFVDDNAYTIFARTIDDEPEWSTKASLDTDNTFENDLEVVSLTVAIGGIYEYGGTNAQIDDNDWFQGGNQVTASGSVEYEGSSQTFDSSYAAAVDVELYYDSAGTSQIDSSISSGAFSDITYTPTSASGLDTTAYFDIVINDIPSGGSDVTSSSIEITSKRDNEDPTTSFSSIVENNPHTYIYATGQTIYFSDLMGVTDQLATITVTASDGSGSGVYCVTMSAWDDDPLMNDTSAPYDRQYSTDSSETSGSITFFAIDNVNNFDSTSEIITMTEDLTGPSTGTLSTDQDTISIGYQPNSNYDDDSMINFTVSGASDSGSGLPTNCYSYNNTAYTSSATVYYSGLSDGNYSVFVNITDNVGNNRTSSAWCVIDTDSPTGFTITWSRVNGSYPCVQNSSGFYYDDEFNNYSTISIANDGTIQNSGFWKIEWDKNSILITGLNDTSGLPDSRDFNYYNDDNGTLIIRIINNAGNYQDYQLECYDSYYGGEPPEETTLPPFFMGYPWGWLLLNRVAPMILMGTVLVLFLYLIAKTLWGLLLGKK